MGARTQTLLDQLAVLPGAVGGERVRFFRHDATGPGWAEHLAVARPRLAAPLTVGEDVELAVETLAGSFQVGLRLAHDAGAGTPLVISHHGNNERPFATGRRAKNFLNRALLEPTPIDASVVVVRAPLHEGPVRPYLEVAGDLRSWMALVAASVLAVDAVVEDGRSRGRATLVTGISLGGWVANLHRAFLGGADRYVPMLAGAHLGRQFVDSSYRSMVSRRALEQPDRLRATLDFADDFRARPDGDLAALLARHDRFARFDDQVGDYLDQRYEVLLTGHLGAVMDGRALREHVTSQLREVRAASG